MKLTIIGTVARIGDEKSYGSLRKRELVVNEGGDESRPLPVEFTAPEHGPDRIAQICALSPGQLVRVEALLAGREWEGRVYLRLCGMSAAVAEFASPLAETPPTPPAAAAPEDPPF